MAAMRTLAMRVTTNYLHRSLTPGMTVMVDEETANRWVTMGLAVDVPPVKEAKRGNTKHRGSDE